MKIVLFTILLASVSARIYPMFRQCDPRWGTEKIGTSLSTICNSGCLISSLAMALAGTGHSQFDPSTLNTWLIKNNGYASSNLFVWNSLNSQGLVFISKQTNNKIKSLLDAGQVVIIKVRNGTHWVLATSYQNNTIFVNDPGYRVDSYNLNEIVDGQSAEKPKKALVGEIDGTEYLQVHFQDQISNFLRNEIKDTTIARFVVTIET